MKKVILFSPKGYIGGFIQERLQKEKDIQLYEIMRGSDLNQYRGNFDIMVYSAAITSMRHATAEQYVQDNVVMAVSIIGFCKEHNIKRIIYFSSDEIYGELNTDVVSVDAIMVNPNLYATTKYLAEKIIMESGIPYYILRLPGVVGRTQGRNFIYSLLDRIKNDERIELYNMEREFNNIVDIDDLSQFTALLCNNIDNDKNEIFPLGNMECVKLKDIVSYMKDLYGSTSLVHNVDTDQRRCFTLNVENAVQYGYHSKSIRKIIDELSQIQER